MDEHQWRGIFAIQTVQEDFTIHAFAIREVQMPQESGARIDKTAQHSY
jgi:hypothetical protein